VSNQDPLGDWLARAREAALQSLEALGGPRRATLACRETWSTRLGLACRPPSSPRSLPGGAVAYATILEAPGAPVYRGFLWLEEAGAGELLLESLDLAAAEPKPPLTVLIHGYASPEELALGVSLDLLGAEAEYGHPIRRGSAEAAARLAAGVLGALILRRSALPAPPTWAPGEPPWLRPVPGGYEAEAVLLYVSPAWAPNTGYAPGMAVPPAGIYRVEPGARLLAGPPAGVLALL